MQCPECQLVNLEDGPAASIMKKKNRRLGMCPNHSTTYTRG